MTYNFWYEIPSTTQECMENLVASTYLGSPKLGFPSRSESWLVVLTSSPHIRDGWLTCAYSSVQPPAIRYQPASLHGFYGFLLDSYQPQLPTGFSSWFLTGWNPPAAASTETGSTATIESSCLQGFAPTPWVCEVGRGTRRGAMKVGAPQWNSFLSSGISSELKAYSKNYWFDLIIFVSHVAFVCFCRIPMCLL